MLTKQLTPLRPVKSSRNILTVGFNLVLSEDNVEVKNVNCTETVSLAGNLDNALAEAKKKAQAYINDYLDETDRNDAEYTDKVNAISSELTLTRAIK